MDSGDPTGLRQRACKRWAAWAGDIRYQIVNTDIDGLLTAALLYHSRGWPIVGFSDTEHIWIDPWIEDLALNNVIWVDLDMCMPGARTLGQHVVCDAPGDSAAVLTYRHAINPNILETHARQQDYRNKYPFGTFQWAWWLLGVPPPDPADPIATGLAWMPDGGFDSIQRGFRANCVRWATDVMTDGPLADGARGDLSQLPGRVREAQEYLMHDSGVHTGWRNHQFVIPRSAVDRRPPREPEPPDLRLTMLLNSISRFYGWPRVPGPEEMLRYDGVWRSGSRPPDGWPGCANSGQVISLAVTGGNQFCWTEGAGMVDALFDDPR